MKNKWTNKAKYFLKKFQIKNERKLAIFLICVGIASVFWLLNALEKEYNVELSFPVRYTNLPKNKMLINEPPRQFVLDVRSFGFTLLRYKLSMAFSPLVFNVGEIIGEAMEDKNQNRYAIPSQQYRKNMADQISSELNVTSILPDTVYFQFDQIVTQKKKVTPIVTFQLKKQHYLYDEISVVPDSVDVMGPRSILDTLTQVKTVAQNLKTLDGSVQRTASLQTINIVEFAPKKVTIQIPVEEYTEKQLAIPVTIDSIPDNFKINFFPAEVKVSFMIGLSRFSEIDPSDFRASVSYADIENKVDYLPVTLENIPNHLKSVDFLPKKIEYLIEK
ncbi:CdaR family protein [Sunxiuqinia dokdonensis]|uniref:YbbR-like domain-containing protein n=1 Tax=Sunxiuqinia dokdonensis TaxID=1409788 RepID=A0A0L8V9L7_9BACT|nr:YbbR-like domain-containing protein [Sunxiuqinia dokdonensis]KOH45150.1 hypothetical protein NC99_20120 [Sunxiuqinia dokdonensis]